MKFDISYSKYTPDSIEAGDAAEHGWEHRDLSLAEVIYFFEAETNGTLSADHGPLEPSTVRWFTAVGNEVFTTDTTFEYSFHIPDCVTPASRKRITRLLADRLYVHQ